MRDNAAGVGSWQRKTSACASLLSDGGTVAGESVRMYWRMEAIAIDVSQELLELSAAASAPIKRTQGALRLAASLGLVALRALCGSRLLCSGSDAIGRLKFDAQTAPRAFMCPKTQVLIYIWSRKPDVDAVVRRYTNILIRTKPH